VEHLIVPHFIGRLIVLLAIIRRVANGIKLFSS
jgi:hypothetical protein